MTVKNIVVNKFSTLLNLLGLAIGLCVFILVYFYVAKEFSYDTQWDNADRIYRMNILERPGSVNPTTRPLVPYAAAPILQQNFPDQVELFARATFAPGGNIVGENIIVETIWLFEKDIINIFSFEVLAGSLDATMADPSRIALTEASAIEYFGNARPLGEILSINPGDGSTRDYEVTAIYRVPAGDTMIGNYFPNIALLDSTSVSAMPPFFMTWEPPHLSVGFFLLSPDSDIEELNRQLNLLVDRNVPVDNPEEAYDLELQALSDACFNPNDNEQGGDKTQVLTFLLIGTLVLLLGIFNYVTLSTAGAIDRRKEAGIRKAAGAQWGELVKQFVLESVLLTAVAMIVALMLVELALPFFQSLTGSDFSVTYLDPMNAVFLLTLTLVTGILGGLYPALIIAKARPQEVLKQGTATGFVLSIGLRNLLLGFQFSIAIALLIATLIMYFQLSFYQNRNHNFNADNLLQVELSGPPIRPRYVQKNTLVEEVKKQAGVVDATLSMREANDPSVGIPVIDIENQGSGSGSISSRMPFISYDFFSVYQIPLLAGRTYTRALDAPDVRPEPHVILNRYAARTLGFANPEEALGKVLASNGRDIDGAIVVGVVEDNQFLSYRGQLGPEIYALNPVMSFFMTVRFQDEAVGSIKDTVESVWRDVYGDDTFNSSFVVENLRDEFSREENEGKLLMTLSFLSIFIACLGLYGLVSFTVKGRVKEIGIRKVMGAGVGSILGLFLWQFSRPVIVANCLAWPLAAWGMSFWMQRFPYQVDSYFLIPLFLMAAGVALMVAWLTVGATAAKVASQKPVIALQYE